MELRGGGGGHHAGLSMRRTCLSQQMPSLFNPTRAAFENLARSVGPRFQLIFKKRPCRCRSIEFSSRQALNNAESHLCLTQHWPRTPGIRTREPGGEMGERSVVDKGSCRGELTHSARWGPGWWPPLLLSGTRKNVLLSLQARRKKKDELLSQRRCFNR